VIEEHLLIGGLIYKILKKTGGKKMNVLGYFAIGWATLFAGYKFLKPSVESIIKPDDRKTAAVLYNDGADFVPTDRTVLFGHHWMSIAGTSPIVASIVGLAWGWLPAFLWMVLGVVFIGGTHDYFATMISSRNKGLSMGELLEKKIGKKSGKMSSVLLAFGGILVFAIFLNVIAGTLAATPTAVFPTVALIPIAMICGYMLHKGQSLAAVSVVGFGLTLVSVFVGLSMPIAIPKATWIWVFSAYTLAAIYLPVWVLLQPRDYVNSFVLIVGMILGILGLIVARPAVQFPAFVGFMDAANRPLWPMLFATISCGAASGWHSLICAGTTSKQLRTEKDGFFVAYFGMQSETIMALLSSALIITSVSYANFGSVTANAGAAFSAALGVAVSHLGFSPVVGATIGALSLSALTLTTLDSFARTGRYVVQELGRGTPLEKPMVSSLFVTVGGLLLYFQVPFLALWSGLVLAGLIALIFPLTILYTERVRTGRPLDSSHMLHVVFPLIFVYLTSYAALLFQLRNFVRASNWIASSMVIFLIVMGLVIGGEAMASVKKPLAKTDATVNM
jgi:carbon starvation protein